MSRGFDIAAIRARPPRRCKRDGERPDGQRPHLDHAGDVTTVFASSPCGGNELRYWYHSDQLQSVQYVTDETGDVAEHAEYFPFGDGWINEAVDSERLGFGFAGKPQDEETGLYDFGARQYDAAVGQWLSADPVLSEYICGSMNGGVYAPSNLALYAYAWNRPSMIRDPDGNTIELDPSISESDANRIVAALQRLTSDRLRLVSGVVLIERRSHDNVHQTTRLIRELIEGTPVRGGGMRNLTHVIHLSPNDPEGSHAHARFPQDARNGVGSPTDVYIDPNQDTSMPVTNASTNLVEMQDVPDADTGLALELGHELIHAAHDQEGNDRTGIPVRHEFETADGTRVEVSNPEELRTSGIRGFAPSRETTEGNVRHDLGLQPRGAYDWGVPSVFQHSHRGHRGHN